MTLIGQMFSAFAGSGHEPATLPSFQRQF